MVTFNMNVNTEVWEIFRSLLPILIPIFFISFTMTLIAIINIVKKPNPWGEKILWLLLVIIVDVIGPVLYFAVGSGYLDEKQAQNNEKEDEL